VSLLPFIGEQFGTKKVHFSLKRKSQHEQANHVIESDSIPVIGCNFGFDCRLEVVGGVRKVVVDIDVFVLLLTDFNCFDVQTSPHDT